MILQGSGSSRHGRGEKPPFHRVPYPHQEGLLATVEGPSCCWSIVLGQAERIALDPIMGLQQPSSALNVLLARHLADQLLARRLRPEGRIGDRVSRPEQCPSE